MFKDVFATKPDAINAEGTSFWLDKDSMEYVQHIKLKNVQVLFLKTQDGYKTRVIVRNGEYLFESQKWEDILCHLDAMNFAKK